MSLPSVRASGPTRAPLTAAPDPFSRIDDTALADAGRRVAASFRNEAGDAVDQAEVSDLAALLAVRVAAAGSRQLRSRKPPKNILARRLLELLRAETIEAWARSGATADRARMLEVLQSFEAVRREIDPEWAEHFQNRLTGPDALELVVEVAHDLRSPLTSILFLAETLQRGSSGDVNDIQRRQLGLIYGAALGLSSLTSDVMELARGGDRLVDKYAAPFSIAEMFESVHDVVQPIAAEKGLTIQLECPATDHRRGHPMALSRVLLNLTTNALKFTDEGSVTIEARGEGRDRVEFSVRDTGRGINPTALDNLYQPFRRTAAHEGYAFSGTGLGLAICRKLVEAMGGTLEVETKADAGTRFHFVIDLPPADQL